MRNHRWKWMNDPDATRPDVLDILAGFLIPDTPLENIKIGRVSANMTLLEHINLEENALLGIAYHEPDNLLNTRRELHAMVDWLGIFKKSDLTRNPSTADPLTRLVVTVLRAFIRHPDILVLENLYEGLPASEASVIGKLIHGCSVMQPFRHIVYIGVHEPADGLLSGFVPIDLTTP